MTPDDTKWADLDKPWSVVEAFVRDSLDGKEPTKESLMHAYSAEMQLETTKRVFYTRPGGKQVHGVRKRLVRIVQGYAEDHPGDSLEQFQEKWERATRFIFKYHERHYVQRCRDEGRDARGAEFDDLNGFVDDGTPSIYDLGTRAWRHYRQEQRSSDAPTSS